MNEHYQIRSVPRMFEQVAKQIVDYILSESLQYGEKIPTERNLSQLLEVSRSSVREGLRVLELLRYLDSKQGEGTFVSEPPPFLIPSHVLKQSLDSQQLNSYFEIGMMCAERIVHICLLRKIPMSNESAAHIMDYKNFWFAFAEWVETLGQQLENTMYLSLWNNVYLLLSDNQFFLNKTTVVNIEDLLKAYIQENQLQINTLFESLR